MSGFYYSSNTETTRSNGTVTTTRTEVTGHGDGTSSVWIEKITTPDPHDTSSSDWNNKSTSYQTFSLDC